MKRKRSIDVIMPTLIIGIVLVFCGIIAFGAIPPNIPALSELFIFSDEEFDNEIGLDSFKSDFDIYHVPRYYEGKKIFLTNDFLEIYTPTHYVVELQTDLTDDDFDSIPRYVVIKQNATNSKFRTISRDGYEFYGWRLLKNNYKTLVTNHEGAYLGTIRGFVGAAYTDKPLRNRIMPVYPTWHNPKTTIVATNINSLASALNPNNYSMTVVLNNDIDLTPHTSSVFATHFNGVLDGNFHTIKYAITNFQYINTGLIGLNSGIIKNLKVDVNIDASTSRFNGMSYVGGIAAVNEGGIINCEVNGSISASNMNGVSFVGGITSGSGNVSRISKVIGCTNNASIVSVGDDAFAAGIITTNGTGTTSIVEGCINNGSVTSYGTSSVNTAAGGIISHSRTDIIKCVNYGKVIAYYNGNPGHTSGGISGYSRETPEHSFEIKDCIMVKKSSENIEWACGEYPNSMIKSNSDGTKVYEVGYLFKDKDIKKQKEYLGVKSGGIVQKWDLRPTDSLLAGLI